LKRSSSIKVQLSKMWPVEHKKIFDKCQKLLKEKKYEQVIRFCDKKINIELDWDGTLYYSKGVALIKLKKHSEAIFWLDKSLDWSKKRGCTRTLHKLYSKGRALYHLSNYNEALFCYNKALDGLTVGPPLRSFNKLSDAMLKSINFLLTEKILVLKKLVKREIEILA